MDSKLRCYSKSGGRRGGEDADSISLEGNSSGEPSKIWIDHNTIFASLTKCSGAGDASFDGGIDMKKGVHHVTDTPRVP
ncbi:hypothetical protein [Xanthomonas phaseoli]|uniref:pectate lyase family protein n=1 Tax=Xanthomonas phaseoli TaxID=1985254 RepID=UPI002E11A0F2